MPGDIHDAWIEGEKLYGHYRAFVADNKDPRKLGRVRLYIPGILNDGQMSTWAWPAGFPAAGKHQRGGYMPPDEGAQAFVAFVMGEREEPIYFTGNWASSKDDGGSGVPVEAEGRSAADAPKVKAFQTDTFEILIIDTAEEKKLILKTTEEGGFLEIDALDKSVRIHAENWLILEGTGINIDGLQVNIKNRVVQSGAARPDI